MPTSQRRKHVQAEQATRPQCGYVDPGCRPLVWAEVHVLSTVLAGEGGQNPLAEIDLLCGARRTISHSQIPRRGALTRKQSYLGQSMTIGRRGGSEGRPLPGASWPGSFSLREAPWRPSGRWGSVLHSACPACKTAARWPGFPWEEACCLISLRASWCSAEARKRPAHWAGRKVGALSPPLPPARAQGL